jgi:hypothetical protein
MTSPAAITGHAPIGEYYLLCPDRFPDFETRCANCPEANFQTHSHVFSKCPKYNTHFLSLPWWKKQKDNDRLLASFLQDNPTAFTFDDLPRDVH